MSLIAAFLGAAVLFGTPSQAMAASPCAKFGDTEPTNLRAGQARGAVRCLLNRERRRRGLSKLRGNRQLTAAAQRHNDHMQKRSCFDHVCPGENDLARRLGMVGYLASGLRQWSYGENIAWGGGANGTPKAMVKAWMNSAGHRANILSSSFRDIGVGFTKGSPYSKRDQAGIYTTDFGLRVK